MKRLIGGRRPFRSVAVLASLAVVSVVAATVVAVAGNGHRNAAHAGPAVIIQRAHNGSAVPNFKGRITLLVVGSDSGAPKFGRGGTVAGGRSDSLHLIVLDPAKRHGVSIGFPRDSFVPIPGHGTDKINASMSTGGPPLLVSTIEHLTGIHIDFFVLTSFDGITDFVNKVGGVDVNIERPVHDSFSGANFSHAGVQHLNGTQALAYARARHGVPGGDLDRSKHQAAILLGGLATFQKQVASDPTQVMKWLAAMADEVQTNLPFDETLRLALYATQIPPGNIANLVVPSVPAQAGSASIVRLLPGAYSLFARVRAGGLH